MNGAFPPSSSESFFTVGAHCAMSSLPTAIEPVKLGVRPICDSIVNTALHVDPVGAHARLAGIAILRRDCAAHGRLEIGIVEHDEWRISAELERELLHRRCTLRHEQLADSDRAREAQLAYEGGALERTSRRLYSSGEHS